MSKRREFNKTIIPFVLVGYEISYSQLGASRLVGYLPSHIQRALMKYQTCQLSRFSRESPSFSSNLPVSQLEHQISREIPIVFFFNFFH